MAALADQLGCNQGTISYWESGKGVPNDKYIHRLNQVYNVDIMSLVDSYPLTESTTHIVQEPSDTYDKNTFEQVTKQLVEANAKLMDQVLRLNEQVIKIMEKQDK